MTKLNIYSVPVSVRQVYVAEEDYTIEVSAVDEEDAEKLASKKAMAGNRLDKVDASFEETEVWCGRPKFIEETNEDAPTPRCEKTTDMFCNKTDEG